MRRRKQPDIFGIFLLPVVSLSISMLRTLALTNDRTSLFLNWSAGKPIPIRKLIEKFAANWRCWKELFVEVFAYLSYDTLPRHHVQHHSEASRR